MITRVTLRDFKAHKLLEFDSLPLLSVLVGRNNTGKSAVFHALLVPQVGPTLSPAFPIGDTSQIVRHGAPTAQVEIGYSTSPAILRVQFNANGGWSGPVWVGSGKQEAPRAFYLSAVRTASVRFNYEGLQRDVGAEGEHTWNILHQLKADDDPRFQKIVEWAVKLGMGIESIGTPTTLGAPYQGQIAPVTYGHKANLVLHGSGTWSVLPIIVQGVLCEPGETLLVEEPESHLHRESIDALWGFFAECAKRDVQVICASHSLDLLASMSERIEKGEVPKDSAIFHIRRDSHGNTTVERLDPSVFRSIRKRIREDLAGHGV